MKVVIVLAYTFALALGAPRVSKQALSTHKARGGGRIVGGENAAVGEFPHQIALLYHGSLMCGGSLISEDRVITAAHCCDGEKPKNLAVQVGSYHLNQEDEGQADIPVATITVHENYDDWTTSNDICLLTLDGAADMSNPNIGTIALPEQEEDYEEGTICTVTGWGAVSEGGHLAKKLKKVDVPVVSDENCRKAYGEEEILDSMICGAQLSGIVSWGYGCAEAGYPGVYTQTSYFV